MSNIYVASSWRNAYQPDVVARLRAEHHDVYDFRHPWAVDGGFHWSEIDPEWKAWDPESYRQALEHPIAQGGFRSDFGAMVWAEVCVLVLPCGRSAHAEAGWMAGSGRRTLVYLPEPQEPELMYKLFGRICLTLDEVVDALVGSVA